MNQNRKKKNRNEKWDARLSDVRAFAHSNNRWPSTNADDKLEKSLAQWWSRQKYHYKKYLDKGKAPGMNEARSSVMSALIDSFDHFERDGKWMKRYTKIKKQIEKHGRLWPYNTTDEEEQRTLRWWNQQKSFCRKFLKGKEVGGMNKKRSKMVQSLQDKIGHPLVRDFDSSNFKEVLGFNEKFINSRGIKDE